MSKADITLHEPCPACGRPSERQSAEFELRAFVFRGNPSKNGIGFSVTPDGFPITRCVTNEGCGEFFYSGHYAHQLDDAHDLITKTYPEFYEMLVKVRALIAIKEDK